MDYIGKFDELPVPQRDLIATIAKTWLAKGEDADVVSDHIKRWLGGGTVAKRDTKIKPVKGDGKEHALEEDGFDAQLAQFHQRNASLSLGRATEIFMRTPEGAAAYKESKAKRLHKAAALCA